MQSRLTPEDLVTLSAIMDPAVSPDGGLLAGVVHDPAPARGSAARADIWISADGGPARSVTSGPGIDGLPRFSPSSRMLAFASDRLVAGLRRPYVAELAGDGAVVGEPRIIAAVDGVVEDIIWSSDERQLLLRVADLGSDTGNIGGGIRFEGAGSDAGIDVRRPGTFWRRLVLVDLATGESRQISPDGMTVWDVGWAGHGPIAAVVSSDATESGWYDARLALVDPDAGSAEELYRSQWQLQGPVISHDEQWLAFLEAPQSDRGLLSGAVVLIERDTGRIAQVEVDADVSHLRWTIDGRLFWAGRSSLESVCGFIAADSSTAVGWRADEIWRDLLTLGRMYKPMVECSLDGRRVVSAVQGNGVPPELSVLEQDGPEWGWRSLTGVNAHASDWPVPLQRQVTWRAEDGLEIHGLLLLPSAGAEGEPLPLVVVPHGGPTNAAGPLFDSGAHGGDALLLAQAGCAVLLPNPRGSVGRGRDFMAANIGDLGGGDLRDLEAGVRSLVADGVVDASRVGVVGISYGGFMSAWAAVRSTVFAASIPIAGISNWLSFHHTSNQGRMDEIFLASSPNDVGGRHFERSPIMYVSSGTTPTLILHGDADLACPIGQAQEFYQGLVDAGCPAEWVTYRGAGHGMQQREHRIDVQERIVGWFTRYLGLEAPVPGA